MTMQANPKLLVSVRSVEEAFEALEGGADLIDVKEPSNGALGAADPAVIASIIREVKGRVPVSAAMGEFMDWDYREVPKKLSFVKWGLSHVPDLDDLWDVRLSACGVEPVLVAYADYERSASPKPSALIEAAVEMKFSAFLIDTAVKDGTTLLDWVDRSQLARWCDWLANNDIQIALAGSLGEREIRLLAPIQPDWFAVRGAACEGGREGTVRAAKVRRLKEIIAEASLQNFGD